MKKIFFQTSMTLDLHHLREVFDGIFKRKWRGKTPEERAAERPPVPNIKKEKATFCKINLYKPNCKEYLDAKLNDIRNPKSRIQSNYLEAQLKICWHKEKGIISEEEFNQNKKQILGW